MGEKRDVRQLPRMASAVKMKPWLFEYGHASQQLGLTRRIH
jgi:hypothetical protein